MPKKGYYYIINYPVSYRPYGTIALYFICQREYLNIIILHSLQLNVVELYYLLQGSAWPAAGPHRPDLRTSPLSFFVCFSDVGLVVAVVVAAGFAAAAAAVVFAFVVVSFAV